MKKLLFTSLFLLVCLTYVPSLLGRSEAASLKFDKTSASVKAGDTFDVQVVIDPGTEQVTSTDAWILYDKNSLSVQSVKDGAYFPTVLNDTSGAGKVYIAGLVNDPTQYKTGQGTVATVTFKALAVATAPLSYECSTTATETSKVIKNDVNSTNIIDCTKNGQSTITIANVVPGGGPSGGTGGSTNASPTPSTMPTTTLSPSITPTPSPTIIIASPTTASISATPSSLPQSGVIENIMSIAVPGVLLMTIGGVLKVLLKI